jgi:hypothetical protein
MFEMGVINWFVFGGVIGVELGCVEQGFRPEILCLGRLEPAKALTVNHLADALNRHARIFEPCCDKAEVRRSLMEGFAGLLVEVEKGDSGFGRVAI